MKKTVLLALGILTLNSESRAVFPQRLGGEKLLQIFNIPSSRFDARISDPIDETPEPLKPIRMARAIARFYALKIWEEKPGFFNFDRKMICEREGEIPVFDFTKQSGMLVDGSIQCKYKFENFGEADVYTNGIIGLLPDHWQDGEPIGGITFKSFSMYTGVKQKRNLNSPAGGIRTRDLSLRNLIVDSSAEVYSDKKENLLTQEMVTVEVEINDDQVN